MLAVFASAPGLFCVSATGEGSGVELDGRFGLCQGQITLQRIDPNPAEDGEGRKAERCWPFWVGTWLVFVSCLPAAAPFLIFSRPTLALRVSNFLLIAMLFVVGRKWAAYANTNRLIAGLAMVAVGLLLVGVAIARGGR